MNRLSDVEVFYRVVQTGSFTAAARDLNISKSYASKQLRALEERLGARLLNRTTRTLTTTDAGRLFAEACGAILDDLDKAERAVAALQAAPKGTLRVSAPMSFGVRYVAPEIGRFMVAHPELTVDAEFSDARVDLVDEGFDLAVRIGKLGDSTLIARKLAPIHGVLLASPDYLARRGVPKSPEDLRNHDCMRFSLLANPANWTFHHQLDESRLPVRVRVEPRFVSNNGDALLEAAIEGVGIVDLPDFFVHDAIEAGSLVRLLAEWETMPGYAVWVLYPHSRHVAAKVRLFVEHLAEAMRRVPWALPAASAERSAAP